MPFETVRPDMPPKQRIEAYMRYMSARRIDKWVFAPAVWRMLWAIGIYLPPPPFMTVVSLSLFSILCGVPVGFVAWIVMFPAVLAWPISHAPVVLAPLYWSIALAGIFIAAGNWVYYRRMARQHGLAGWASFTGLRQRD